MIPSTLPPREENQELESILDDIGGKLDLRNAKRRAKAEDAIKKMLGESLAWELTQKGGQTISRTWATDTAKNILNDNYLSGYSTVTMTDDGLDRNLLSHSTDTTWEKNE